MIGENSFIHILSYFEANRSAQAAPVAGRVLSRRKWDKYESFRYWNTPKRLQASPHPCKYGKMSWQTGAADYVEILWTMLSPLVCSALSSPPKSGGGTAPFRFWWEIPSGDDFWLFSVFLQLPAQLIRDQNGTDIPQVLLNRPRLILFASVMFTIFWKLSIWRRFENENLNCCNPEQFMI